MRITFLLTQSLESPGGGGRFFPMAKALVRAGHRVTILALHHNFQSLTKKTYIVYGVTVRYVAQMHVRKVGDQKFYYSSLMLIWVSILATVGLTWAAVTTPCDIIQVCKSQPFNAIAAWFAHIIQRRPVFIDIDDYETLNNRFSGAWQQNIVAWFEKRMPFMAKYVTVSNSNLANQVKSLGFPEDRIILVPHGFDPDRFNIIDSPQSEERIREIRTILRITPENRVVCFVGSISLTSHAIDILIEAFSEVIQHVPEAILILVGGGEDMSLLVNKTAHLNLSNHVRFLGKVPLADVPLYLRLSDVSVDPKRDRALEHTTLSLKLFESIAAGIPCVTADTGDSKQIIQGAGVVVKPGDSAALAQGILEVLNNGVNALAFRNAAKQIRSQYNWDHLINRFTTIYRLA